MPKRSDDFCPHCYPSKNMHHNEKANSIINFYLSDPLEYLITSLIPKKAIQFIAAYMQKMVLHVSYQMKHARLTDCIDRSQLNNGILVIWDEARKRGLDLHNVSFGKKHTQYFLLKFNNKTYYFDRNPIYLVKHRFKDAKKYDDKHVFKKTLFNHQIPHPQGKCFISKKNAFAYGMQLGFPLVVKPVLSSFSRHVSFNIQTEEALHEAINIAKEMNHNIIVEQHIEGRVHRATVLEDVVVGCTKREAASIIGNGTSSIESLIKEKNKHPLRGHPAQLNCTLHKIQINVQLRNFLAKHDMTLESVLPHGKKILLNNKMSNGHGADVTNVTDDIHPENVALFVKIHRILNVPLSGLDFICQDVSLPWQDQQFAIIENNSLPYIDAHHYPSIGAPINVASKIWDFVLNALK